MRGKKLQAQLNKTYSDLNRAAKAFQEDNDMTYREYQDSLYNDSSISKKENVALKKFMSYFNGYTDSNYSPASYDKNYGLTNLHLNGGVTTGYPCQATNVMLDTTGRMYAMYGLANPESTNVLPKICVDINGNERPNTWGVDRFVFLFTYTNSVVPSTAPHWPYAAVPSTEMSTIKTFCSKGWDLPVTCAYFALKNISPYGKGDYWHDFLRGKY